MLVKKKGDRGMKEKKLMVQLLSHIGVMQDVQCVIDIKHHQNLMKK